ncbi:MAG: hypothetical protein LQ343_000803 [Gyalolechia ehrenbergii]|nr:MAG: hypothetical protein LQ343_000803 [Gyalolechia ehrenbergii]
MLSSFVYLCFGLVSLVTSTSSQAHSSELQRRRFEYGLPTGYSVDRQPGVGELDPLQAYGAIIVTLINLAYGDSGNLTDPVSYPYPAITLNITGPDDSSPYYRQFASYTLYNALETMSSTKIFTVSNFTLQNKAGAIACKVILAPPSAEWQQLIGGSLSGGLSPRTPYHNSLPSVLKARQASRLTNESAPLENLTPLYASDWYGPESTLEDFFLALATTIVMVSDVADKDVTINSKSAETAGYHLNVTNVPVAGQGHYFTSRGVLNLCAHAYGELSERLAYGSKPIRNFETTLVWTNGTDLIQQHVLRYEGPERCGGRG